MAVFLDTPCRRLCLQALQWPDGIKDPKQLSHAAGCPPYLTLAAIAVPLRSAGSAVVQRHRGPRAAVTPNPSSHL